MRFRRQRENLDWPERLLDMHRWHSGASTVSEARRAVPSPSPPNRYESPSFCIPRGPFATLKGPVDPLRPALNRQPANAAGGLSD